MAGSVVEREVVPVMPVVSDAFTEWLVDVLEDGGMVAVPGGEREPLEFGAVRTVGSGVELTWMRFVRNPRRVVLALLRLGRDLERPVVVAERDGHWVWLAVGSHCAAGTAGAVGLE